MSKKKYNHTFDVMFSINTDNPDFEETTINALLFAIARKLSYMEQNPGQVKDCVEDVYDSFEVEEDLPEEVVHVPEKFIVESAPTRDGLGLCDWNDITAHLKTDPHPKYRLVSVSIINQQSKIIWELSRGKT